MNSVQTVRTLSPGTIEITQVDPPTPGPRGAVVKVRACGICGTDTFFVAAGGAPMRADAPPTPVLLGHEVAGEIVELGPLVQDLAIGDHVVVNPLHTSVPMLGVGGPSGGMRELLLVDEAVRGESLQVIPDEVPFAVAALNEPLAVAKHAVNRSGATAGDRVVVFGAGPIGLGATIWLKLAGVRHVVVADVRPERLEKALAVGADAVIDSGEEDFTARLTELHGEATNALGAPRAGTDVYLDAAGVGAVFDMTQAAAKWGARLVVVAVHKQPVDISGMLRSELTVIGSMGYPTEIFDVTPHLAEHWQLFAKLISHDIPFERVREAYTLAATPGAAEKVVVTFGH